jgi:hypothetical protein
VPWHLAEERVRAGLERDGLVRLDENRRIVLIGGEYIPPDG